MDQFDVVVIGAGPAGGQMARAMAKLGYRVLLVEQHEDFSKNDFSSAATLLSTLDTYDLPNQVIGTFWNRFIAVTSNTQKVWDSDKDLGVVLDFAKLKQFLADDVVAHGGEVWMGHRYVAYQQHDGQTVVTLKQRCSGDVKTISARVLVDATGFARSVMYKKQQDQPEMISATGIEYLIEVDDAAYQKYLKSIVFFLGYQWMPKGYSWIFPMAPNRLKVGAGRFNLEHQDVKQTESLKYYIQLLIDKHIKPQTYEIVDIHGSTIKYSEGLNDIYYKDNVIAVGDAVSTVNCLGGEGIRHGMEGAEIASTHVAQYLEGKISDFQAYQTQMQQHLLPTWDLSAKAAVKMYLIGNDAKIDEAFTYLGFLKTEEIIDVLFHYKFGMLKKGSLKYILSKVISWSKKLFRSLEQDAGLGTVAPWPHPAAASKVGQK